MPNVANRLSDPRVAVLFILALTLWRVATLAFDRTELWVDEAQYWLWGQHLDWGYFSKPPLIAFWLRAVTDLAGSDSAFWIRISGAFLHAATAGLIGLSATRLYDRHVGALAAVIYASLPMVALGSWLFSTDTVLLPCFALAFLAYLHLTEQPSKGWALVFGAALGLAVLAKYAAVYFLLSFGLAVVLIPAARIAWRDAAIGLVAMTVVAAPNIWWNIANGGTTLRHVAKDNADIDATGVNPAGAVEFFASQFAVFGPVPFAVLLGAIWLIARHRAPAHAGLLILFSLPAILLMTFQGLRAEANANWAVTAYVAGSILVAALLVRSRLWLGLALAFNLVITALLPVLYMQGDTLRLPNGRLVADRYIGMAALSETIKSTAETHEISTVVANRRAVLADLFHRYDGSDLQFFAADRGGLPHSYYEQTFPLPPETQGDVLFIATGPAPCDAAQPLRRYSPTDGQYRGMEFTFWQASADCLAP